MSCGREFGRVGDTTPATATAASSAAPATPPTAAGRKCPVDGCPGVIRGATPCECCQRRAAYLERHLPKRACAICGGTIVGRGMIKYCKPCKPVAAKVSMANAPSNADPKKQAAAAT